MVSLSASISATAADSTGTGCVDTEWVVNLNAAGVETSEAMVQNYAELSWCRDVQ